MGSYDPDVALDTINRWNKITNRLVGASSIPFSILVLPQLVQNVINIANGNAEGLTAISWMVRRSLLNMSMQNAAVPSLMLLLSCSPLPRRALPYHAFTYMFAFCLLGQLV